ncbi:hypothetical protein KY336_00990 [Candidatus Woesearchaeota archaeon]|nr:hypothetical protein [Candidatus Woesearchaeota archaeon]
MNDVLHEHYEEVKDMFGFGVENFKRRVIGAFRKAKKDMDELKKGVHEWIFYLDRNQRDMEFKIKELEAKIKLLEEKQKKKVYVY